MTGRGLSARDARVPPCARAPALSIGIPFVDDRGTLPLAIRSVFAQTVEDWELILLDDGSTDGSLEVARGIADPRVRVLSDGENRGLACRLNELTRASRAPLVVRMDADDAMAPTRLERQLAILRARPELDVVGSAAYLMDGQERVYAVDRGPALGQDPALFLRNRVIIHPTVTARRAWMLANPYAPGLRRGQDKELFLRTHAASRFHKLQAPLLLYRELGSFDLGHYRLQRALDRRLAWRYGPAAVGWAATARSIAGAAGKEAAYAGAARLGLQDGLRRLLARRSGAAISECERAEATALLAALRHTPVPGLAA